MKLPIFVYEHGDLNIFETVEDLENYLEPIDVENDEYIAYDGSGHLLKLKVKDMYRPSFLGPIKSKGVRIEEYRNRVDRTIELKNVLIDVLKNTGKFWKNDQEHSLEELIKKVIREFGYTK